jgi:hypothetical protein
MIVYQKVVSRLFSASVLAESCDKAASWYNRNMITQHSQNAGASYNNLHPKVTE